MICLIILHRDRKRTRNTDENDENDEKDGTLRVPCVKSHLFLILNEVFDGFDFDGRQRFSQTIFGC